jgi:hypothetical protein
VSDALKLGTLGLVAALSRTILAIATLGYVDEEGEPTSNGGSSTGVMVGLADPSFGMAQAPQRNRTMDVVTWAIGAGIV